MTNVFDDSWINLLEEPAIDPHRPIIDAHLHIWTDKFSVFLEHFGKGNWEDFQRGIDRSGHNVMAGVHVTIQASYSDEGPPELRPVAETEFLEGEAVRHEHSAGQTAQLAAGIVAGVDMMLGTDVDAVLEAHLNVSPTRVRGVRHPVAWHPSPLIPFKEERGGILVEPQFIEAARCVARRNLALDVFVFYNQLPEVTALARLVPDLRIILNHSGGIITDPRFTGEADAIESEWKASMRELATCPNVVVKLGGMGMPPLAGDYWTRHELPPTSQAHAEWQRPYVEHMLQVFSPNRAMFQSNFPTEIPSANYGIVWNAFKHLTSEFSEDEKSALFFDNALHAYQLNLSKT
jgi:predicted TIM-barrel fold metal-dependent hydrolase